MCSVERRAQQPALFRRKEHEGNGARRWRSHQLLRDSEQHGDAGSIVREAVVDRIAASVRRADAEVIVMRREQYVLSAQRRIAARNDAYDIAGGERLRCHMNGYVD